MRGGLQLISRKDDSSRQPLTEAPAPAVLRLSMRTAGHMEVLIADGDHVYRGQLLARSDIGRLHSSASGRVATIEMNDHGVTMSIENDELDESHPDVRPVIDYSSFEPHVVRNWIAEAGIVGLGGAAFPTSTKLDVASNQRTKLLIINGVECEPFITCDDALMRACPREVVVGTQILLHASGATEAVVAIEADKPDAIAAVSRAIDAAENPSIRLQVVPTLYPAGGERQLIQTLTAREVPSGGVPADIDVLCQNVGTTVAVSRLIETGEPLMSRVVTITGSGVKKPSNLRVRFGTPIAALVAHCGGYTDSHSGETVRLLIGGTMMGISLADDSMAVSAATNCIIVATPFDIAPRGYEMPCIRCGDCAEVCPAALLPQQLFRSARAHDTNALHELGLRDCIECGCCDYVCPSQIPLTSTFDSAKRWMSKGTTEPVRS